MIGIIAGEGLLPKIAKEKIEENNKSYIIGFEKCKYTFIKPNIIFAGNSVIEIITELKKKKINKILLCGAITFPGLKNIKIDSIYILIQFIKLKFFTKNNGDDLLLKIAIKIFKKYNIETLKIQDYCQNLLAKSEDSIGKIDNNIKKNAQIGIKALNLISSLDIAQALVIKEKRILGIEDIFGTDKLIERFSEYKNKFLVKSCKINQNMTADVATVGEETIKCLHKNKYLGLILKANQVIILEKNKTFALAKKLGIVIYVY